MTTAEAAHSGGDENPSAGNQPDASVVVGQKTMSNNDAVGQKSPDHDREVPTCDNDHEIRAITTSGPGRHHASPCGCSVTSQTLREFEEATR